MNKCYLENFILSRIKGNGKQLVRLFVENNILVLRERIDLLDLSELQTDSEKTVMPE